MQTTTIRNSARTNAQPSCEGRPSRICSLIFVASVLLTVGASAHANMPQRGLSNEINVELLKHRISDMRRRLENKERNDQFVKRNNDDCSIEIGDEGNESRFPFDFNDSLRPVVVLGPIINIC